MTKEHIFKKTITLMTLYKKSLEEFGATPIPENTVALELVQINDYTTDTIRNEKTELEESNKLNLVGLCPSRHGGLLDYPKMVTESSALVTVAWDTLFQKLSADRGGDSKANGVVDIPADDIIRADTLNGGNHVQRVKFEDNHVDEAAKAVTATPTGEEEFCTTISESGSKLLIYHSELTETLVKAGDIERLTAVVGGMALTRNKLWHYNEVMVGKKGPRPFQDLYREVCELVEAVGEQIMIYHCQTMATVVLQDSESQDWEDCKEFHEGERISYCIQMWWFTMETTRQHVFGSLPPSMAVNIMLSVLNDSLGTLCHRYCSISPSAKRIPQFRGDITAILLSVSEVLPSLCTSIGSLTSASPDQPKLSSIHAKCELLLAVLVLVTAPSSGLSRVLLNDPNTLPRIKPAPAGPQNWLQLICPDLYTTTTRGGTSPNQVYLLARLVAGQSQPCWALLVQLTLAQHMMFSVAILSQLGAFVPNAPGGEIEADTGCGAYMCTGHCLGPATAHWPMLVAHGILTTAMMADMESKTSLAFVLEPLLVKLSPSSWDCISRTSFWCLKKPVWLAALVHTLEPYLSSTVLDLMASVESGATWTLNHLPKAQVLVMGSLLELADLIPLPILGAIRLVQQLVPSEVEPICGSVPIHIILATLYSAIFSLVPKFRANKIQKEKVDFLIAFSESLCNLELLDDLAKVEQVLNSRLDSTEPGKDQFSTPGMEEFQLTNCEVIAYSIVQEPHAKAPLTALYRFICYNCDWIGWALGADIELQDPPRLKPWNSQTKPALQPATIITNIGTKNVCDLMAWKYDFEELATSVLSSPNLILTKLLDHRAANNPLESKYIIPAELNLQNDLRDALVKKIAKTA